MDKRISILGGGPAGYSAALEAARLGARVTLIEREALGGTCLHRGCIPTKTLLHSAELLHAINRAGDFGVRVGQVSLDFPAVLRRKEETVARLRSGLEALMRQQQIRVVAGTGRLLSSSRVAVAETGEEIAGEAVILAPGSRPKGLPQAPGAISSDQALSLLQPPASLIVVGGGVVGVELAQLFSRLGGQVTLLEMMPHFLPGEDEEMARRLGELLRQEGIEVITGARVTGLAGEGGQQRVAFSTGEGPGERSAPMVLAATGREAEVESCQLREAGVALAGGRVEVDENQQTSLSGVYAAGDVVGGMMLAHAAMAQGRGAARRALGLPFKLDHHCIPRCLFTSPQLAAVGLSEREAGQTSGQVLISRFPLSASGKAHILGETQGLVKVIADKGSGEILGVHILAPGAGELIGEAVLAMRLEATAEDLTAALHPHPTLSEALGEACSALEGGR